MFRTKVECLHREKGKLQADGSQSQAEMFDNNVRNQQQNLQNGSNPGVTPTDNVDMEMDGTELLPPADANKTSISNPCIY